MAGSLPTSSQKDRRHGRFKVGDSLIDPSRNIVSTPDGEEALEPRIMDVLCFLSEHPGEVLTRGQMIDAVWARSFGADESLTRAISRLRKVLGDGRSAAEVIETIPKRGYRLIAPVTSLESHGTESKPQGNEEPRTKSAWPLRRLVLALAAVVAVMVLTLVAWSRFERPHDVPEVAAPAIALRLPRFESLDASLDRNARVIGDRVAGLLSQSALLGVRRDLPPDALVKFGYTYTVRGTLQRVAPDSVRASIALVDNSTGMTLWSGTFDRVSAAASTADGNDFAATIAAEVYNRVLSAAKTTIRKKPANELVPWELTLLATWVAGSDEVFLSPHGPNAFWPQQRALALDPKYAPAHASLASAMAYHALFDPAADTIALRNGAREHANRARALAPYDAAVLYELATYYRLIGDRADAAAALDRVLALQPGHPVARYDRVFVGAQCTAGGRNAVDTLRSALDGMSADNPVRWVILSHIADLYLAAGNADAAIEAASSSRQIVHMTWSGITLAAGAAQTGDQALARAASAETRREWPTLDWGGFVGTGVPVWCLNGAREDHAVAAFAALGKIAPLSGARAR